MSRGAAHCGSASKPILLELERQPAVAQAWLNRAGTLMAVVWSEQSKRKERAKTVKAVLVQRDMKAKELKGKARQEALNDFESPKDWYRGADVDRLSEEEAGVIVDRWINRFRQKITLADDKAKVLQDAFTTQLKRHLCGHATREETREEMIKIARHHLDEKDFEILMENFGNAFRPNNEH
ncbi:MAG: hypothetical protein C5B50_03280 [Verrucomicrobia bacterium]|nr:MAG: hypothetical protein C5B50_03280 [Verrucomicrobiota bacterium]